MVDVCSEIRIRRTPVAYNLSKLKCLPERPLYSINLCLILT